MATKTMSAMKGAKSSALPKSGFAIFATVAMMRPAAAAATPARMRCSQRCRHSAHKASQGSSRSQAVAPAIRRAPPPLPAEPRNREPKITEKLTMLGPGSNCENENASLNCSAVSHLRSSTSTRRAHGSTPPKPASDIDAKIEEELGQAGLCGCAGCGRDRRLAT